eukprot:Gb_03706 [translate_table: standard]
MLDSKKIQSQRDEGAWSPFGGSGIFVMQRFANRVVLHLLVMPLELEKEETQSVKTVSVGKLESSYLWVHNPIWRTGFKRGNVSQRGISNAMMLAYEAPRGDFGHILVDEAPTDCDGVIVVPNSGVVVTLEYAIRAKLSFQQGLVRSDYVGRTFVEPPQKIRDFGVKLKLAPVHGVLEGKRVIVVDDSIVRDTTSSNIVRLRGMLGEDAPSFYDACFSGVYDVPHKDMLAQASGRLHLSEFYEAAEKLKLPKTLNALSLNSSFDSALHLNGMAHTQSREIGALA